MYSNRHHRHSRARVSGGWGPQDAEQGNNGGWGTEAREVGSWGPAETGTETHTSPAIGISPTPGLWGQDAEAAPSASPPPPPPEQSSWANPNLLTAALGAIGFGAQPAANAGATPTLKKKSTLKKSPPAAAEASLPHGIVSSPASRHVAFGATSLYSPTTAAPPPAPPPPSSFASQKAAAASRAMHSRNQTYGGWESGFGAPTAPQPGFGTSSEVLADSLCEMNSYSSRTFPERISCCFSRRSSSHTARCLDEVG